MIRVPPTYSDKKIYQKKAGQTRTCKTRFVF